ncbi:hypothetical protein ACFSQP_06880 [Bizionia sediminis]|uniref:O-antigen ligase domain-containing protein n=1 Tax=Bizionia sediminis TaxID=1737064 RepID=A0ABW5KSC6_9FLAO
MLAQIRNHNTKSVQDVLLGLVAAALLFKLNIANLAVILAVVYNIVFFKRETLKKLKSFVFVFPVVFFVITVLSSVFSRNFQEGIRSIDLNLLMVLLAFIVANATVNTKTVTTVFRFLFYAAVLSVSALLVHVCIKVFNGASITSTVFHEFTALYDQHPVYYAILLSLALIFLYVNGQSISKYVKAYAVFVLIVGLAFCASKAVLFFNAVAYTVLLVLKLNNLKAKLKFVLGLLVVALVYNTPFVKERFVDGLKFHKSTLNFKPTNVYPEKKIFTYEEKQAISDLELRYIMATLGIYHTLESGNALTGFGEGDIQDNLDYYYLSYNLAPNWNEGKNIHNQYIHMFITYGVFTCLFFICYMVYSCYMAIRSKSILHIFFIALVSFVFIFEVILVRNIGIILFYFFNTLLIAKHIYFENSNFRNKRHS